MKLKDAGLAALSALLILLAPIVVPSQQSASDQFSQSEQEARSIALSALGAMGGQQVWTGIADSNVTGICTESNPSGNTSSASGPFTWITKGVEFRYENGNPDSPTIVLSAHGQPQAVLPNETRRLTYETGRFDRPFYLPALVLLMELNDGTYRFKSVGEEAVNGIMASHVQIVHLVNRSRDLGSEQDWWFDPSTGMPLQVTFRLPGQAVQSTFPVTYAFSQWSKQTGLEYPAQIAVTAPDAGLSKVCAVSQVKMNTQPADSLFNAR